MQDLNAYQAPVTTPRLVPASYYSAVAREAVRLRQQRPDRSVSDVVEVAFGFTPVPVPELGSVDPTAVEERIVTTIMAGFPLVAP